MKYMMDERPDLNEKLMDFYCYLREMKSPNPTNDSTNNLKRVTVEESDGVDMNLDEMIWDLGMNLPSWDIDSRGESNDSTNGNNPSGEIK